MLLPIVVNTDSGWDMSCSTCPWTHLDCVRQGHYCEHNHGISYDGKQSYVDCHHQDAGTTIVYRREGGISRVPNP
jgi:hypothetical protein